MKPLLGLAVRSAWNRRGTLSLVVVSVALATLLLLGIERIRGDVRRSFSQAVSGTDLIVGARTSPVQLMLFSVFRIGSASDNLKMTSVEAVAGHPAVSWVVPIALGDSYRGHSVVGTTTEYFRRFRYGDREPLVVAEGRPFAGHLDGLYEAVLGAEVARALGLRLGQPLVLSHGSGGIAGSEHADKPFTVVGILAPTGTPVDRSVHVSLEAIEAIHLDWFGGAPTPGLSIAAGQARKFDLRPKQVTAALVGLKSRAAVFNVQRFVAAYQPEALSAVLPGVALDELWSIVGTGERALLGISALVAVVSLAGLVAVVLAGLNERRRELAVLRAVGAGPRHVLLLLVGEGSLVASLGIAVGVALTALLIAVGGSWTQSRFGIRLQLTAPDRGEALLLAAVLAAGILASLVPALRAYRLSLADGLSPPT